MNKNLKITSIFLVIFVIVKLMLDYLIIAQDINLKSVLIAIMTGLFAILIIRFLEKKNN